MAEGGKTVHVHNYYISGGIATVVAGDTVGTKADIKAGEIGVVTASAGGASHEGPTTSTDMENLKLGDIESDDTQPRRDISRPTRFRKEVPQPTEGSSHRGEDVAGRMKNIKLNDNEGGKTQPSRKTTSSTKSAKKDVQTRPTPESKAQKIKAEMISDKAKLLIGRADCQGAVSLLEDRDILGSGHFLPKLLLAECYLKLGKDHKAMKTIGDVKSTIMTSSGLTPRDVKQYAIGFTENSFHVRAMILLRIASDMYETSKLLPNAIMNGIYMCISKTDDATKSMIRVGGRAQAIGVEYGIEYMREMYEKLREVKHVNPVDIAENLAWSCKYIGSNLKLAKEYRKSIKILQTGVEILEQQFGPRAANFRVFGVISHNIGNNYYCLNKYPQAESYLLKAIEAKKQATDYDNNNKKQQAIELAKDLLKDVRADFGKK